MGVSENGSTPTSSILIGLSVIDHPFWGTPIFGPIYTNVVLVNAYQDDLIAFFSHTQMLHRTGIFIN